MFMCVFACVSERTKERWFEAFWWCGGGVSWVYAYLLCLLWLCYDELLTNKVVFYALVMVIGMLYFSFKSHAFKMRLWCFDGILIFAVLLLIRYKARVTCVFESQQLCCSPIHHYIVIRWKERNLWCVRNVTYEHFFTLLRKLHWF